MTIDLVELTPSAIPSPEPTPIIRKNHSKLKIALISVIVTFAVILSILALVIIWKYRKDREDQNGAKDVHLSDLVT